MVIDSQEIVELTIEGIGVNMDTATLDVKVNEGATFSMDMEFWETTDKSVPMDITNWTFEGNMKIGNDLFVMGMLITAPNLLTAEIAHTELVNLGKKGSYDISALYGGKSYRVFQGAVTVSPEVAL